MKNITRITEYDRISTDIDIHSNYLDSYFAERPSNQKEVHVRVVCYYQNRCATNLKFLDFLALRHYIYI